MTRKQALRIYKSALPNAVRENDSDPWWEAVVDEIEKILSARSDRAAGEVIRWWNCWPSNGDRTATATARRIRETAKRMGVKP